MLVIVCYYVEIVWIMLEKKDIFLSGKTEIATERCQADLVQAMCEKQLDAASQDWLGLAVYLHGGWPEYILCQWAAN